MRHKLLLGDCLPVSASFPEMDAVLKRLQTAAFLELSYFEQFQHIQEILCQLIREFPEPAFLLGQVIDFLNQINRHKVWKEPLNLAHFEMWLNQFSGLSEEGNRRIRGKIVGKWLPREEYQLFFPIGMHQTYFGTHFVAAHLSPDIDTMTASFCGWLDAFAARIGSALHVWSLPGGAPDSVFTSIFEEMIGRGVFTTIARTAPRLLLTAMDLLTQKGVKKETGESLAIEVDPPVYLYLHSDIDEMRQKMRHECYLTVVDEEKDGELIPLGIVRAEDLKRRFLGTISFRDFSNHDEVKMASYLELISVVDHHKSSLKTASIPSILIADVQSSNVLMAETSFVVNDRYSCGGMDSASIEAQIEAVVQQLDAPSSMRILQRLLQRKIAIQRTHAFYIDPSREFQEYLSFLYAILDDTDLLTKVSARDVLCVGELLNRLKSLTLSKEVEIVQFEDLPRDADFAKKAARRILQQEDMYSLYKKIYFLREEEVKAHLALCVAGKASNLFLDTKEQSGCARVGQTKLFSSNFSDFICQADEIRTTWLKLAQCAYSENNELTLHMQMISTIASAEDVYRGTTDSYTHRDEIWIWTPSNQLAGEHLNSFLSSFSSSVKKREEISLEIRGEQTGFWKPLFNDYFKDLVARGSFSPQEVHSVIILRFPACRFNSRKTAISVHLPQI